MLIAPVVYVAGVTVLDVTVTREPRFALLLAVAPAFAGAVGKPRHATVVAAAALAGAVLVGATDDQWITPHWQFMCASLVLVGTAAVVGSCLRQRGRGQLERMRTIALAAQQAIMRAPSGLFGELEIASAYAPAEDEAMVGGDFYEALRTPYGFRLLMGDVRGKGMSAVSSAASVLFAFRVAAREFAELADVAEWLSGYMLHRGERSEILDRFATCLLVEIPERLPLARLISYGHPPPLLVPSGGGCHYVRDVNPSPPLGITDMVKELPRITTFSFEPGDRLLLFTDGVTEARDARGRFYPLERRFPSHQDDLSAALNELVVDVERHSSGRLFDDAAMLLVRRRDDA